MEGRLQVKRKKDEMGGEAEQEEDVRNMAGTEGSLQTSLVASG